MKFLLALACAAALTGCATREYGSWLDNVGRVPSPPAQMSDDEAGRLTAEAARLRAQAEVIRVRVATQTDRVQRYNDYSELRKIGDELRPIERRLADAGRNARVRAAS